MDFSHTTKEALLEALKIKHNSNDVEFEVIFRSPQKSGFKTTEFESVVKMLRSLFSTTIEETLTISLMDSPFRFTIKGNDQIKQYCKTNKISKEMEQDTIIEKKNRLKQVVVEDYNFRVNVNREQVIPFDTNAVRRILRDWEGLEKTFRYRKRYSFLTKDNRFRYDMTVVKSSTTREKRNESRRMKKSQVKSQLKKFIMRPSGVVDFDEWWNSLNPNDMVTVMGKQIQEMIPKKNVRASKVFTNPHNFEMELEYLGKGNEKQAMNELVNYSGIVLQKLQKNYFLLSENAKRSYFNSYKVVTKDSRFIGPQPITLERNHVASYEYDEYPNVVSIRKDYCVTDKADGERNLLYIAQDGEAIMINRKNEIKSFGCKFSGFYDTIIDGEYIQRRKDGSQVAMFMAFDIYFHNNVDIRNRYFFRTEQEKVNPNSLKTRLEILQEFQEFVNSPNSMKVKDKKGTVQPKFMLKTFYFGDTQDYYPERSKAIEQYRELLRNTSNEEEKQEIEENITNLKSDTMIFKKATYLMEQDFPYHIDGLIFTPVHLEVNQERFQTIQKAKKGGRWNSCFKWKPSEENSIDFRVKIIEDENNKDKIAYINQDGHTKRVKQCILHVGYDPKQHTKFNACRVLNEGMIFNDEYSDTPFLPTIPYIKNAHIMSVEVDSTNMIRCEDKSIIQNGDLVECRWNSENNSWVPMRLRYNPRPNDFSTAINVWKSIHYPVTKKMIVSGNVQQDETEHVYYKNIKKRSDELKPLSDFHSFVKKTLIKENTQPGSIMLDVSVGKGGDLNHWLSNSLGMCVGIDVSQDNLTNENNGACNRVLDKYNSKDKDSLLDNILLIWGDSGKSFSQNKCAKDVLNQYYLDIVFGNIAETQISSSRLRKFYNIGNSKGGYGFDAVSCQFSLHYFFKNELTLRTLLENVSYALKVGGKFFGTCLDGQTVYQKLNENNGTLEGMEKDKLLWKINKLYNKDFDRLPNTKDSLGVEVEVFMETIGSSEIEYLVNFEYLEKLAQEYNMRVESIGLFEPLFSNAKTYGKSETMTDTLKEYSFMNRKFILIKTA